MRTRSPRLLLAVLAATLLASIIPLTTASAATPDLSGYTPDYKAPIPVLAAGSSATVGGVVVKATTNTAGGGGDAYLFQSKTRLNLVLTFDKPIPGFEAKISYNADCRGYLPEVPTCFEQFDLTGKDASGAVVFTKTVNNTDGTFPFMPGTGAGQISGLISTLEAVYSYDTAADSLPDNARGSYLELLLSKPALTPDPQYVNGSTGTAITATTKYEATGFAGAVTYAITEGTLPAGLTLDPATGVISGTPTEASYTPVTITATGAVSGVATAKVYFSLRNSGANGGSGGSGGAGGDGDVTPARFTG